MASWIETLLAAAPWAGTALMGLIFLANAVGVLDQRVAVHELAATGMTARLAGRMVTLGRLVQLGATPCLFVPAARPVAALVLAGFLIGATLTAHAFWKAQRGERDRQLANFLKNVAIIGGLLVIAGWRSLVAT